MLPPFSKRPTSRRSSNIGFTLVELLVSTAVMAVVMALILQIVSSVSRLTELSKRRMDAISQVAFALDRLGADFQRAVHRPDLLPYVLKQSGNDVLSFYSQVPGYGDGRELSSVTYAVRQADGSADALVRGVAEVGWVTEQPVFSTSAHAGSLAPAENGNQVLASVVYRFEVGFIDRETGAYVEAPATTDWSDIAGVVVTMASIDEADRKLLGAGVRERIEAAVVRLKDFDAATAKAPAAEWQEALQAHGDAVMTRSRILQRTYGW